MKTVDLSLELSGHKLAYPILLDPTCGKNCCYATPADRGVRATIAGQPVSGPGRNNF